MAIAPRRRLATQPQPRASRSRLRACYRLPDGGRRMKLQMVGCSHHTASRRGPRAAGVQPRSGGRGPGPLPLALSPKPKRCCFRPATASSCISPANRRRLARRITTRSPFWPSSTAWLPTKSFNDLFERTGEDFVRHLFTVAASLDSMVVGEAQILVAGEAGLRAGHQRRRNRPADERRLSGGAPRRQARRHGNGHPAKAGQHSQRRRRRLRQERLRAASTTSTCWSSAPAKWAKRRSAI